MGSPPLITDDPGTPGDGRWEINLGVDTERRSGQQRTEIPLVDLNYGIGPNLQLKYEVPFFWLSTAGQSHQSGLGDSEVGIKWRFRDPGTQGTAISIYPQWEFHNPGSSASHRGIDESGSTATLPVQLEKDFGCGTLNLQVGRTFRSDGDSWLYGAAFSHAMNEKLELGGELAGNASAGLTRSQLAVNFGVVVNLSARTSLNFSAGRELHNHFKPRASLLAYAGCQLRL